MIDVLKGQSEATGRIVESLSDDDFARDVLGCPGWKIGSVVGHLTIGAQLSTGAVAGDVSIWESRTQRAQELARLTPAEARRRCLEANEAQVSAFQRLPAEDMRTKTVPHPILGDIPLMVFASMRIVELTAHGWDIESGRDPDARSEGPGVPISIENVSRAFPAWALPEKIAGIRRAIRLSAGSFDRILLIEDGKASWSEAQPDATLAMEPGDPLLLMAGRLSSRRLCDSGRATAEGDVEAARGLSDLFKPFGGR